MGKTKKIILGILFWIVQLTWGALLTYPGLLISLICIVAGGKVHKNGFSYMVEIGKNYGGISIGAVTLCCECSGTAYFKRVRRHEFGHSIQNMILGPFQLFLVAIPSVSRYWYFKLTPDKPHQDYDYALFEYTASKWGYAWINKIEGIDLPYTYKRVKKVL